MRRLPITSPMAILGVSIIAFSVGARAQAVMQPIGAKPDGLTGSMSVTCRNTTSGKAVTFDQTAKSFDCRENGLAVNDGDHVKITLEADAVPFAGHTYQILQGCGSWDACEAAAEALGGHLATLTSAAEDSLVNARFIGYGHFWIGATDVRKEGTFKWVTGERFHYTNWAPGQPDNQGGIQDCVQVWDSPPDSWDDLNCATSLAGVAEIDQP